MISTLNGRVIEKEEEALIVELGGIGLCVHVPSATGARYSPGQQVFLYTTLIVREELLALYGFDTKEERRFFELLLGVSGIGPRLALAVLSALNTETIRRAIVQEQADIFSRVPGVGKKTAQKIVLHLHDRIPVEGGLESLAALSDVDSEVLVGLTSLGYSVIEAQAALQSIPRDAPQEVEERLRLALRYFTKP
ncbi:MAG: Holliday junction branch migration protein RuvA [Anaerolineales bacterium]|nr:Holliday junction branch migration protein RuvA [Anaerolineales bacterium]MDD5467086.1 Holliday junction branch migration protein RuvA [Anaerolineales bacterium]